MSPFGDRMTRKYDKRDRPNDGETTWTNTGATRSGRGDRLTWRRHAEAFVHPRTPWLPNDDGEKDIYKWFKLTAAIVLFNALTSYKYI